MVTISDVFEELLPYSRYPVSQFNGHETDNNGSFTLHAQKAQVDMSKGSFTEAKKILDGWLQYRRQEILEEMHKAGLAEWILPPDAFERKITVNDVIEATQRDTLYAAQLNYIRILALRRALG